jgi:CHAT domain-containing protein
MNYFTQKKSLSDKNATRQQVENEINKYKIVHFSTHGLLNDDNPLFSGVLLTGSGDDDDGILKAYEIINMNISSYLVTLSACNTGLGKYSKGMGITGLARSFMHAGAKNLIVSLWSVDDKATSVIMNEFYKNLIPENKIISDSLKNSQLFIMNKTDTIKDKNGDPVIITYMHPFFWAPFIIIGTGR